jgi:hypothetical protein
MRRFTTNRWCAFILAFGVSVFSIAALSGSAYSGQQYDSSEPGAGGDWVPGGANTPPPQAGDPDMPGNGLKGQLTRGAARPLASQSVHAAGDGMPAQRDWMGRVQVVLQLLRQRLFLRF